MITEERREARRKRILENSASRLKKITTPIVDENLSNEQAEFVRDNLGNNLYSFLYLFLSLINCMMIILAATSNCS